MRLVEYVDELMDQFYHNLQTSIESFDMDAIHDFRVALKKLFVLEKVLHIHYPALVKNHNTYLQPIKRLFKISGVIRDHQVSGNLANEWLWGANLIQFTNYSFSIIKQAQTELCAYYADVDITRAKEGFRLAFQCISDNYLDDFQHDLLLYVADNEKKIFASCQLEECDFHAVRRWVKEQYYILWQLKQVMGLDREKENLRRKYRMGKLLGEWHDLKVFERHLKECGCKPDEDILVKIHHQQDILLKETFLP